MYAGFIARWYLGHIMLVRWAVYISHPVKDYECNIMKDLLASGGREFCELSLEADTIEWPHRKNLLEEFLWMGGGCRRRD